jgi:hypothetical protein
MTTVLQGSRPPRMRARSIVIRSLVALAGAVSWVILALARAERISAVWLGFFARRDKFPEALDAGQVLPPAKNLDDMHQVITNSTVDGVLAALFVSRPARSAPRARARRACCGASWSARPWRGRSGCGPRRRVGP